MPTDHQGLFVYAIEHAQCNIRDYGDNAGPEFTELNTWAHQYAQKYGLTIPDGLLYVPQ